MKILFLTLVNIRSFEEKQNIYTDLCREFVDRGHTVHIVCPDENGATTTFVPYIHGSGVLRVQTGRVQKTSLIRKGITTLMLGQQFKKAIAQLLRDTRYDLVIYSTPPITLMGVVEYIKKRDGARTYLLLKDIFPQNAVDLGMMAKRGPKAPIYWYFRHMEKKLYAASDRIGCMSQANVDYLLRHNPEIDPAKVEICPNSVEVQDCRVTTEVRNALRNKYGIPLDKKIFVYGGNLGKPQGIPFIIECLKSQLRNPEAYFLIVGDGTEYKKLEAFFKAEKPTNMKLMKRLPKEDYDRMVAACDVGMIFLDYRFTIPNFPSRLLSYMQASLPVLCCTDPNTDIGKVCVEGGFGMSCFSHNPASFTACVEQMSHADLHTMGKAARRYLKENYSAEIAYVQIWGQIYGRISEN